MVDQRQLRTPAAADHKVKCGIYTRVSTDEGLGQELNSLDVQWEACCAFVRSQVHEGWILSPDRYDDPAFSGGNMKRPALQRILADVSSGAIDIIVVYKIDRLTRSLTDFAKIVETLDAASASFVSITQAFNTSTSMGRLTLNVLLSFAQFERELGSERVRDKIAASKARGMWTGGTVPLGYDLVNHKLVPNAAEAAVVRQIMETYLECGSVPALLATLEAEGVRTKKHVSAAGQASGGIVFRSGAIRHLLRNETYLGRTKHRDKSYPGQHEAIIDEELWARVQALTASNTVRRRCGMNARHSSLLAGLIHDQLGRRMTPSHTLKGKRPYLYYASNNATMPQSATGGGQPPVWRIPAAEVESSARRTLAQMISEPGNLLTKLWGDWLSAERAQTCISQAQQLASTIPGMSNAALRKLLLELDVRVIVHDDHLELSCNSQSLRQMLVSDFADDSASIGGRLTILVSVSLKKRGHGLCLVIVPGSGRPNQSLVKLMVQARAAQARLFREADLPGANAYNRRPTMRLARLSYLAPDIVMAILNGEQPEELTSSWLRHMVRLPVSWVEQRRLLGFPAASATDHGT
jgi:DNA invertase Pin-like site-specific DNA recombinase